jgi:phenylpropionate dioxygenase-like ring-hydroxylating dioxygenase large terminal subunit
MPAMASWVRGARSADLGRSVLVWRVDTTGQGGQPRTVLLWRTRRGRAVAMDGRCPHRQYLMADARIVGNSVECAVHGYRYGPDGRCVNVRRAAPARLVGVREYGGYLWLAL